LSPLPNGVDTDLFHPVNEATKRALRSRLGIGDNEKVILFVGRPVPKKGFDKVLAACDDGYRILCAGGEVPAAKNTRGAITFLGRVSQERLAEIYQASDVFLLPSESEGFPLSVQEAMACGLPIITTNDEGYERYHFDKNFISLLDHPDGASVRAAVKALIPDDARLKAMGAYSERYAKANFGWQTIIEKLRRQYERLISVPSTIINP
jgi:glycosyltransferase involved in cell wall biosynthesis